jgi:hypothetical protein
MAAMRASVLRPDSDRRQHPRRACRLPVVIVGPDGGHVVCDSVDVSVGGMRVVGDERMPVGPVDVVIDELLALHGEVVEEIFDLPSGRVTARIVFASATPATTAELVALAELPSATPRVRRARNLVAIAGVLGVLAVGGVLVRQASTPSGTAELTTATQPAVTTTVPDDDAPEPIPTSTSTTAAPTPTPTPTSVPAPAAVAPTPRPVADTPPAPAFVTTTETADNAITVTISEDPAQSSGSSFVGPSAGVDRVRVELDFSPEATAAGYPVAVTIENRSDAPITFDGGATAVITATAEDGTAHEVTVTRTDVTELAPGTTVRLDGVLPLEPGRYDLTSEADVTAPR